jgi:hypothetical protein
MKIENQSDTNISQNLLPSFLVDRKPQHEASDQVITTTSTAYK